VVDQLAKLASLLESSLLTREEFDRLKAGLPEAR
jgi:putative oligomerization/nucleic acid binding protein